MKHDRPQILFLAHRVPYPPNKGDRIRSFNLLRFLAVRADVHLAFLTETRPSGETLAALEGLCRRVAAVRLGRHTRWVTAAWSLGIGRTATEGLFASRRLRRVVTDWASQTRFDAVLAFCSSMAQHAAAALTPETPLVVDLVDVDSQKWLDYAATSKGPKRLLFALEGRRLRRLERSLAQRADALAVVSQREAELYQQFCPSDRVHVIPNGVNLERFRPCDPSEVAQPSRCVFVGALDYRANVDGLRWFVTDVWPAVRKNHPDLVFQVVGRNPSWAVRRLARQPGVELVGAVEDVRPWLAQAALVVVPLRVARGIQNKVLEALAMSKAVLATPQAIEGLAVVPDVHLTEAATPEQWVRAMQALLSDPHKRESLGRQGRAYVEACHQWDAQLAQLVRLPGFAKLHWPEPSPLSADSPASSPLANAMACFDQPGALKSD